MPVQSTNQRECVYVIGAGFSAGLGYLMTSDLLFRLWGKLDDDLRRDLSRVVRFHHPGFDERQFTSYPNIEELLSEMLINEKLFKASRQYNGQFTIDNLINLQRDLLLSIGNWFHELSKGIDWNPASDGWLHDFKSRVEDENAALISFNWDLILDKLLFGDELGKNCYRLKSSEGRPVLLKPHGSLNWFEHETGQHIQNEKRVEIYHGKNKTSVYAFLPYRAPVSKNERVYTPLIVPPVHLKQFDKPIFTKLWQDTVSVISTAKKVVFLGYSMPATDLHVQFIMRCGFHNQMEGVLKKGGTRASKTGEAEVIIVNPDQSAAKRIAAVAGPKHECSWVSSPVNDWVARKA